MAGWRPICWIMLRYGTPVVRDVPPLATFRLFHGHWITLKRFVSWSMLRSGTPVVWVGPALATSGPPLGCYVLIWTLWSQIYKLLVIPTVREQCVTKKFIMAVHVSLRYKVGMKAPCQCWTHWSWLLGLFGEMRFYARSFVISVGLFTFVVVRLYDLECYATFITEKISGTPQYVKAVWECYVAMRYLKNIFHSCLNIVRINLLCGSHVLLRGIVRGRECKVTRYDVTRLFEHYRVRIYCIYISTSL